MSEAVKKIQEMVQAWELEGTQDPRDQWPDQTLLNELLFHAELRYCDYRPFKDHEPEFVPRLVSWLENLADDGDKKHMFRSLDQLIYVDHWQMQSLYREAYRGVVVPWISQGILTASDMLAADYEAKLRGLLAAYHLYHVTQSFDANLFRQVNGLTGVDKLTQLTADPDHARGIVTTAAVPESGIIVFEDVSVTGNQAMRVLKAITQGDNRRIKRQFIPLVVLEDGLIRLRKKLEPLGWEVTPALTIAGRTCLRDRPLPEEPRIFPFCRPIIRNSKPRVLAEVSDHDRPPMNAFGYGGIGALIVTSHNAPNNTLPVIHRRTNSWHPLFRRLE